MRKKQKKKTDSASASLNNFKELINLTNKNSWFEYLKHFLNCIDANISNERKCEME